MMRRRKAPAKEPNSEIPDNTQAEITSEQNPFADINPIMRVTTERLFKVGKDYHNCAGLYLFYVHLVGTQGMKNIYATTKWTAKRIHWSVNKVKRIKAILTELGMIKTIIKNRPDGTLKYFIRISFIPGTKRQQPVGQKTDLTSGPKNDPTPIGPKNDPQCLGLDNKDNALGLDKDNIYTDNSETEDKEKPSKPKPPDEYIAYTESFLNLQAKNHGRKVKITSPIILAGANAIDKLVRLDGFDYAKQIKPALDWSIDNDFWNDKIFSLASLRKQSKQNDNTKFVNVLISYDARKQSNAPSNGYDPASAPRLVKSIAAVFNRQDIGSSNLRDGLPTNQRVEDLLKEMVAYHKAIRFPRGPGSTAARDKIQRSIGTCPNLIDKYCTWVEHDAQWIKQPGTLAFGVTKVFKQFMDGIRDEFYGEDILPKEW